MKRLALLLLVLLAAGVFAAAVLADTTPPATTTTDTVPTTTTTPAQVVADGVAINGVALGGLSSDQAVAAVQAAFGLPLTLQFDTTTISVSTGTCSSACRTES